MRKPPGCFFLLKFLKNYSDGRTGNDIQYLSRDEIIADVLREYERYLSIIADEDKSMVFIDKKQYGKG